MMSPLDFLKNLLDDESTIFQKDNTQDIEMAVAILLSHVIMADGKVTIEESENIKKFYAKEFGLSNAQTQQLFNEIMDNMDEIGESIDTIKSALQNDKQALSEILKHINNLILCDGCIDKEYTLFEALRVFLMR